jgi:hypothetical protein
MAGGKVTHRHDHCPECGVSAGLVCRDLDDEPAVETCPDRPLLPIKRASRSPRDPYAVGVSKEQKRRHALGRQVPKFVPCEWCGVQVKLLGGAVLAGRGTCPDPVCRREVHQKRKRELRAARNELRQTACEWCRCVLPMASRSEDKRAWCDDEACQRARRRLTAIGSRT